MASRYAFTYEESKTYLKLFKDALHELVFGQAKHYRIGTREFTALDLDEIKRQIEYFSNLVESYETGMGTKNVRRVVFRDL